MAEMLLIFSILTFSGILVYFRYTDVRNVTVKNLKDYLKQSEKHIEVMLREKEKIFQDKMIESEIVIERMNRLSLGLKEKLDLFDDNMIQGEDLYKALRQEMGDLDQDLSDYRKIRIEFKDIEDRIGNILGMKQQAEEGTAELQELKKKVNSFSEDYQYMTEELQNNCKQELNNFFITMQDDLSQYLNKAKHELEEKDKEMTHQIKELSSASGTMVSQIKEFKEYVESSVEQLKHESKIDIETAKATADAIALEIYDMWNQLREDTKQDKDIIESEFKSQKHFFESAEENFRHELESFKEMTQNISSSIHTQLELSIQEKNHEIDTKIANVYQDIDKKGLEIQEHIGEELNTRTISIKEELERLYSAFIEQEQSIEDRIKALGGRVSEGLTLAESNFHHSIVTLQDTVDQTKMFSETVLKDSQNKIEEKIIQFEDSFREKIQENMGRIEETFRDANQERMVQSINEITNNLEIEFRQRYQHNVDSIFKEAEKLDDLVKEKMRYVDQLDNKFQQTNEMFNKEKEKIILMSTELEKDRENSRQMILEQLEEYIQTFQVDLTESIQKFFEQGQESLSSDQILWKERYDESIQESREEYLRIKQEIDNIYHLITNIKTTSLDSLQRGAERITQEIEHRIEDLKKNIADHLRNTKEEFQIQRGQAQHDIKGIKQELWNEEESLRQQADKNLERLNNKIKDIDKQFQNFTRKAEKMDKVEDLINKFQQRHGEINDLKNDLSKVTSSLQEAFVKGEDSIQKLHDVRTELENKADILNANSSEADRIQESLWNTMKEANNVSQLFDRLKEEKQNAEAIETLLLRNLETFDTLQESLVLLESKKATVEELLQVIQNSENSVSHVVSSSEEMRERIHDLNSFTQEIKEKLGHFQSEMRELAGDQTKLRTAVSSFNDLDIMVEHIDEEMKKLQRMLDWIAKAQKDVDRIGTKSGLPAYSHKDQDSTDDTHTKSIVGLYEQNWSIGDIAKNLKLSTAYVELIIERYRK